MAAQANRKSNTPPKHPVNSVSAGCTGEPIGADVILELIEQHRAAYQAWQDTIEADEFGSDGYPKLYEKADRLFRKLIRTDPQSVSGAAALLRYVAEHERPFADDETAADLMTKIGSWLEARTVPAKATEIDPVFAIIADHRAKYAATEHHNVDGFDDKKLDAVCRVAWDAWWRVVDAVPTTKEGAVALARYVAENAELNPDTRRPGVNNDEDANAAVLVALRMVEFLSKP